MDVDELIQQHAPPSDITLLLLQEQHSLAERQEVIVGQQQEIVQGQKAIQYQVQQLQSSPPARKRTRPHSSDSPPDGDADDEDEYESANEEKPRRPKLPNIFHVMRTLPSITSDS